MKQFFLITAFLCVQKLTFCQTVNNVDQNFFGGWYSDEMIKDFVVQDDGKIIVVGDFTTFNDQLCYGIIRLNSDFSVDTSFHFGTGFKYDSFWLPNNVVLQQDGKILVAGKIDKYNGTAAKDVVRINTDGSLDLSFSTGVGLDGDIFDGTPQVLSIDINEEGKIVIVGSFKKYNGVIVNNIALLNEDGTLDPTFISGDGIEGTFSHQPFVNDVEFVDENKIFLVGEFDYYNNVPRLDALRIFLDGNIDTSYHSIGICYSDSEGYFKQFHVNEDGSIFIAGSFDCYGGDTTNGFIKVKSNGEYDSLFNNNLTFTPYVPGEFSVNNFFMLPYNRICLATNLGSHYPKIIALNPNGTNYTDFDTVSLSYTYTEDFDLEIYMTGYLGSSYVNKMLLINDSTIYVAGKFNNVVFNNAAWKRNYFFKLEIQTGVIDLYPGAGFDFGGGVTAVETEDQKIIVAGSFKNYNSINANGIVRIYSETGGIDTTFQSGSGFDYNVHRIILQEDGKIIAVGKFRTYNGMEANNICRLLPNGELDTSFSSGTGLNIAGYYDASVINDVIITPDGKIIIVGGFSSYNDNPCNHIARLNSDGSYDSSFLIGTGAEYYVFSIALQSTGKILLAGRFEDFDSHWSPGIVRLNPDGSFDETFHNGIATFANFSKVGTTNTDKIFVAGYLDYYDGYLREGIARLNENGYIDPSFNPGESFNPTFTSEQIFDFEIQPDGKLIICGLDYFPGSHDLAKFVRLNTNGTEDVGFGSYIFDKFDTRANDLLLSDSMDVYLFGKFNKYQNYTRDYIVKIKGVPFPCVSTFTSIDVTICEGESYTLPWGEIVYAPGAYTDTLEAVYLCDSIISVALSIETPYYGIADVFICEGEGYELYSGEVVYDEGVYVDSGYSLIAGCDSIVTITLHKLPVSEENIEVFICEGESYELPSGSIVTEPGYYTDILTSVVNGCDSIVYTELEVYPSFLLIDSISLSVGDTYILPDGSVADTPGIYETTFETIDGCDSVYITVVEIFSNIDDKNQQLSAHLFPNPTDGNISIILETNISEVCEVYITDLYGNEIESQKRMVYVGANTFKVDLSSFNSGIYFVKLYNNNEFIQKKFIITH